MWCCLCTTIKNCINRNLDCCYKSQKISSNIPQSSIYCGYPYCPGNYTIKDKKKLTIKFRGNYYCDERCIRMHKQNTNYRPDIYMDGEQFDYASL